MVSTPPLLLELGLIFSKPAKGWLQNFDFKRGLVHKRGGCFFRGRGWGLVSFTNFLITFLPRKLALSNLVRGTSEWGLKYSVVSNLASISHNFLVGNYFNSFLSILSLAYLVLLKQLSNIKKRFLKGWERGGTRRISIEWGTTPGGGLQKFL